MPDRPESWTPADPAPPCAAQWRRAAWVCGSALALLLGTLALPRLTVFHGGSVDHASVHLLLEMFAVVVSVMVASMAWHALSGDRGMAKVLVCGFSLVAGVDMLHAISYADMPDFFTPASTGKAVFFWLAARWVEVLTVLAVAAHANPPGPRRLWLALGVAGCLALFWVGSFHLDALPPLFVPGLGVTALKSRLEYGLVAVNLLVALWLALRSRRETHARSLSLAVACFLTAVGEVSFTSYVAPSDFLNMFGHVYKVVAYVFIYQATFAAAVREPYRLLQRSERVVRQQQGELKDVLANVPAEILRLDRELRFLYVNPAFAARCGRPAASFVGQALADGLPPDWLRPVGEGARRALDGARAEFEFEAGSGSEALSTCIAPEHDEQGQLIGVLAIVTDRTAHRRAEHEALRMSLFDALTDLPNRRLMLDRLHQALAHARRSRRRGALLLLDLDQFKQVNEALGHDLGDALLREAAGRLQAQVGSADTVARMGGDEFVVLVEALDADAAEATAAASDLAEKIRLALAEGYAIQGLNLDSSASIGLVMFGGEAVSEEELLKRADIALYRAKELGRNRVAHFDPAQQSQALERARMLADLKRAVGRDELRLHYQPVVDAARGLLGYELLLRWQQAERGMVSPLDFIPLAEQSGLIYPIGDWVLQRACEQLRAWEQDPGRAGLTLAVNVSARQFKDPDFVASVVRVLAATGANADRLRLELTESMLHSDLDETIARMTALRELGVRFSLDDFGTGYSSLSYLKRLPLDQLKIDRAFVKDLPDAAHDAAIARTILALARTMGMAVVAEGVETAAQFEFLKAAGCGGFQGYLFGRPSPEPAQPLVSPAPAPGSGCAASA